MYKHIEQKLDYIYYLSFKEFWTPILKKQVFKAKLQQDKDILLDIKENIYRNIHLKNYRVKIVEELGIYKI